MSKMKKIIMVVMIVFVSCSLIAMTFEVKATGDGNPIDISGNLDLSLDGENEDTPTTEPNLNTVVGDPQQNLEQNSEIIQPDINNTTENLANTLPKTGVTEDITVMFFIVVCAVSAIYAYKKIRDYKM